MMVALGIGTDGRKIVLGLRERATECQHGERVNPGSGVARAGLQRPRAVCVGRRQGVGSCGVLLCRKAAQPANLTFKRQR